MITRREANPGPNRRTALAAGAAVALAACGRRGGLTTPRAGRRLDIGSLGSAFPALAERARPGLFAIGVMSLDTTETWCSDTQRAFTLAGLGALPLAGAVMAAVEAGRMSLAGPIDFGAGELSAPFSIINQRWPAPPEAFAARAPVATLLKLALQWGDNTAGDVLMARLGGPGAVTAWLRQRDVKEIRLDRYARELATDLAALPPFRPAWKDSPAFIAARDQAPARVRQQAMGACLADPRDAATLPGVLDFLAKLVAGELVSPADSAALLAWMEATGPGGNLLRAGWPAAVAVAHKGAAAATDLGFTPVTGDLAVITLPDRRRYAMAGFLAGSTATGAERAALFAQAARLAASAVR
ncbi:MAG: serine hydrolase [Caulobacteraceae bacterium]|nr:serine hydrolase [Caulobacteraceae bacterium]